MYTCKKLSHDAENYTLVMIEGTIIKDIDKLVEKLYENFLHTEMPMMSVKGWTRIMECEKSIKRRIRKVINEYILRK